MIPLLRRDHHRWMTFTGAVVLYFAGFVLVACLLGLRRDAASAATYARAAAWAAALGFGLILVRKLLSLGVRPNEGNSEERKELGRQLAMTKEEFLTRLKAHEERSG
jgi:hypothetical protein